MPPSLAEDTQHWVGEWKGDHLLFLPTGKPAEAGPHRVQCAGPRGPPPARKGECCLGKAEGQLDSDKPIVQLGWPQTGLAAGAG